MRTKVILWTVIMVVAIFIASISQILLKISANKSQDGFVHEYINIHVIIAYLLLFSTTILSVLALRYIPLYIAASMEALAQVFVAFLGKVVLKESMSNRKKTGLVVILIGIVIVCI